MYLMLIVIAGLLSFAVQAEPITVPVTVMLDIPAGAQGPIGPQGPKGDQGVPGISPVIDIDAIAVAVAAKMSASSASSVPSSSSKSSASSRSSAPGALSISVKGNNLIDAKGNAVQLRGVNLMGFEFTAIQGWSPKNPFPQLVESNWQAMHDWHVNAVRVPLNEDSWLNLQCVTQNGSLADADPGDNYQSMLKTVVDRATSEGLYVILDLHWTAPNDANHASGTITDQCALGQNPVPDADHAIDFWTGVAQSYKEYGNVMFELFNEPFPNSWGTFTSVDGNSSKGAPAQWGMLRDGSTFTGYIPQWNILPNQTWQSAGMQEMLNAIRTTGATNVVLESGMQYTQDLSSWLQYHAVDPLHQLAAAWHAYPTYGAAFGTPTYSLPNFGENAYTWAQNILSAGYPVIVTEYGDQDAADTMGAPFASSLLPRLDKMGISYLGWAFTVSGESSNILIKDNNGTPTDGYGIYVKAHYLCMASGASCP